MNMKQDWAEPWLPHSKLDPMIPPRAAAWMIDVGISPFDPWDKIVWQLSHTPSGAQRKILGTKSTKMLKSQKVNVNTAFMYGAPFMESGVLTCANAGACRKSCLGHSTGRMRFDSAQMSRIFKVLWLLMDPEGFRKQLMKEIWAHHKRSKKLGMRGAVRLNGSTDILWEEFFDMESFNVMFYDYTKHPLSWRKPVRNYHLTFSLDERMRSWRRAMEWLGSGYNAALVIAAEGSNRLADAIQASQELIGTKWHGYQVIDGDAHDARFLDDPGSWVALFAKGTKALNDTSGFVRRFELQHRRKAA